MAKHQMLLGRKFAFIHVPKTGGMSVRWALKDHGTRNEFYPHISARCLRDRLGSWRYRRLFTFAFVRHPLSWLVSYYHHVRRQPSQAVDMRWRLSNWRHVLGHRILSGDSEFQPVDDYLEQILNTWRVTHEAGFDAFIEEGAAGRLDVIPQSQWLVDDNGASIVNYVGRFEQLQEDLETACARMRISPARLAHDNKGNYDTDWREFYDDRLTQLAAHWMHADLKAFGYDAGA